MTPGLNDSFIMHIFIARVVLSLKVALAHCALSTPSALVISPDYLRQSI
jgi:hypothetical protein